MVRFIFVCMAITALAIASIVGQSVTDGIGEAHSVLAERNAQIEADMIAADTTAEALNQIDTASGDISYDPNDSFKGGFAGIAPKALAEPTVSAIEAPASNILPE